MTEITRCNRIGFHYNGFLNVLDNSNPAYNAKSSKKNLKKIIFAQTAELGLNLKNAHENLKNAHVSPSFLS